jgi:FkbM family methyltransferase
MTTMEHTLDRSEVGFANWLNEAVSSSGLERFRNVLRGAPRVCLFGAGYMGLTAAELLSGSPWNVHVTCFCDNDPAKWGQSMGGLPCVSPAEIQDDPAKTVVLVTSRHYEAIQRQLAPFGFASVFCFANITALQHGERLSAEVTRPEGSAAFADKVRRLQSVLTDEHSRRVADTLVRNWFLYPPEGESYAAIETPHQYFPEDLIRLDREEAFVDVGAFDGETTLEFFRRTHGLFSVVHVFELDRENCRRTEQNLRQGMSQAMGRVVLHPVGLADRTGEVRYSTRLSQSAMASDGDAVGQIVRLDDALGGRPATFIKMDIEGAERAAIEGAVETLRLWQPKLAVCTYHAPEDLLEIPVRLHELLPAHRIYLRHHTPVDYETVCYAVPARDVS